MNCRCNWWQMIKMCVTISSESATRNLPNLHTSKTPWLPGNLLLRRGRYVSRTDRGQQDLRGRGSEAKTSRVSLRSADIVVIWIADELLWPKWAVRRRRHAVVQENTSFGRSQTQTAKRRVTLRRWGGHIQERDVRGDGSWWRRLLAVMRLVGKGNVGPKESQKYIHDVQTDIKVMKGGAFVIRSYFMREIHTDNKIGRSDETMRF